MADPRAASVAGVEPAAPNPSWILPCTNVLISHRSRGSTTSTSVLLEWPRSGTGQRPNSRAISPTKTPSRPNSQTALALSSHPTPGAYRPRSCTSGTASSAATSSTVAVSTSMRSASRQGRPSPERCPVANDATPATTARPARRRSRESPKPCRRENASTSSFADWRRRFGRKSKSYPKAIHLIKFVRLFTISRTPQQSQ